jgi:hypothetical protein
MIVDDHIVRNAIGDGASFPVLIGLSIVGIIIVLVPNLLKWRRTRNGQTSTKKRQAESNV